MAWSTSMALPRPALGGDALRELEVKKWEEVRNGRKPEGLSEERRKRMA